MGVDVTLTGNGTIGPIIPGWSVREDATPIVPGDSSGGVGQISLSAGRAKDSEFVYENKSTFTHPSLGALSGEVMSNEVNGSSDALTSTVDFTLSTPLGRISAERTARAVGTAMLVDAGEAVLPDSLTFGDYPREVVSHLSGDMSYLYPDPVTAGTFWMRRVTPAGVVTSFSIAVAGANQNTAGMVTDQAGNYYIGFNAASVPKIYKYSPTGTLLTSWGGTGSATGQFGAFLSESSNPLHWDTYYDRLFVADTSNNRVQVFSATGVYGGTYASPGVYAVTTYLSSTVITASYDGVYRVFNTSSGVLIRQSTNFSRGNGQICGLEFSSDGRHLLALVNLGTQPGTYAVARIQYDNLAEVQTWYFNNNQYVKRFSIGPNFITFAGQGYAYVTPNRTIRMLYTSTKLQGAFAYYLSLVGIKDYKYYGPQNTAIFPGWTGNVWDKIKQLCTVWQLEVAVVDNGIVVRPSGQTVFVVDKVQEASVHLSIGAPAAKTVTLGYNNASTMNPEKKAVGLLSQGVLFDAKDTGLVITVNAGETVIQTVTTTNYPAIIDPPSMGGDLNYAGTYAVIDSSNPAVAVSPASWLQYGGDIKATENIDNQSSLDIYVTGPGVVIPGTVGPYRIASTITGTGVVYPALSFAGYGVFTDPKQLTLNTAASESRNVADGAADVNNPFMATLDQAYDRGAWASSLAGGPTVDLTMSVPTLSLGGFGLTSGAIISFKENKYRISSITYRDSIATISASRSAKIADFMASFAFPTNSVSTFTNLFANPSFETGNSAPVQAGLNLLNNPSGRRAQTGYSIPGGGGYMGNDPGLDTYFVATSAGSAGAYYIQLESMFVLDKLTPSATYTFSAEVLGVGGVTPGLSVFGNASAAASSSNPSNWSRVSVTFTMSAATSGSVGFAVYNASAIASGNIIAFRDAQVEIGTGHTGYFDGYAPNGYNASGIVLPGDFTSAWLGAGDNSPTYRYSILPSWINMGVAWGAQSTDWANERNYSLRIKSTYNTTGTAFAELVFPSPFGAATAGGNAYRFFATVRTAETRTVAPFIQVTTRVGAGAYVDQRATAPSTAPGVYPLSLNFTVPLGCTELYIRLYNGSSQGGPDVWFDSIAVIPNNLPYTGGYFDGYSPDGLVRWKGFPDNSQSEKITANRTNANFQNAWPSSQMSDFTIKPLRVF